MAKVSIKEALKKGALALKNQKEASILLEHYLECDKIYLILNENKILPNYEKYIDLIKRRLDKEPIEYITQKVSFFSQEFFIKKGALIPRPESEILVEKAVEIIKKRELKNIAEIGVGSGAISIMLALLVDDINIVATDIEEDALKVAEVNIKKFNLQNRITLKKRSYLDRIYDKFDMIISNPPYIANNFKLDKSLYFEPKNALFGGVIGDEILKNIINLSIEREVKYLLCEIGYDQKEPIKEYLKQNGITDVKFYRDLASYDRGFVAKIGRDVE